METPFRHSEFTEKGLRSAAINSELTLQPSGFEREKDGMWHPGSPACLAFKEPVGVLSLPPSRKRKSPADLADSADSLGRSRSSSAQFGQSPLTSSSSRRLRLQCPLPPPLVCNRPPQPPRRSPGPAERCRALIGGGADRRRGLESRPNPPRRISPFSALSLHLSPLSFSLAPFLPVTEQ